MAATRLFRIIHPEICKIALLVFFVMCTASVALADQDIGLTIRSDGEDIPIAVGSAASSPLKIYKNGTVYGIQLVNVGDSSATKMIIKLPSGATKAWKRFSLVCDSSTLVVIYSRNSPNALHCPSGYAAFGIDDTTSANPNYIALACCPLPKSDILVGSPTNRGKSCQPNEVATGCVATGGNGSDADFICTSIDTSKYKLDADKNTCYLQSGGAAAGRGGAAECYTPPTTVNALLGTEPFGIDLCVGSPYGALIVSKNGRNCDQNKSRVLRNKATGQPVQMFPPE